MDNLVLNALIRQLKRSGTNAQIEQITATNAGILFQLDRFSLFFCCRQELPAILKLRQHSTQSGPFAALANKLNDYLSEGKILSIEKSADDRRVRLQIENPDSHILYFWYDAIPRYVNLTLAKEKGDLVVQLRDTRSEENVSNDLEPRNTDGFFANSAEQIAEKIVEGDIDNEFFLGLDPMLAQRLIEIKNDKDQLDRTIKNILNADFEPGLYQNETGAYELLPKLLEWPDLVLLETFDDPFLAGEIYFRKQISFIDRQEISKRLSSALKRQRRRLKKAHKQVSLELKKSENDEKYSQFGDLILANLHQIKRGMTEIEIVNIFSDEQENIIIELAPLLDPPANAQLWYSKAKKMKRSKEHLENRFLELEEQQAEIARLATELNDSSDKIKELRQLEGKFLKRGWLKQTEQRKYKKKKSLPGRRFVSSEGMEIVVGKSSKENEVITFQVGKENDFWMHAAGIPGSHVIIRNEKKLDDPPPVTLQEAASLAAYYSKARNSSNILIHWTHRRNVKKFKGATPGKVLIKVYSSILAEPEIPAKVTHKE